MGPRDAMRTDRKLEPRYSHLFEVLDGAAALHMAIRRAEEALLDPDLDGDDRALLESVLEASRERHARISAILRKKGGAAEWAHEVDDGPELSERDLLAAGRAAETGSEEAEIEALRGLDRLARGLRIQARQSVETFLAHSSPLLRASAIKVLALHWRLVQYVEPVLWTLTSDEEPECRRAAALALGSLYEGTRDRQVGQELVVALSREGEEPDVRWAAYYALLIVDGADAHQGPLPVADFDAARETDPYLLARYSGMPDSATIH